MDGTEDTGCNSQVLVGVLPGWTEDRLLVGGLWTPSSRSDKGDRLDCLLVGNVKPVGIAGEIVVDDIGVPPPCAVTHDTTTFLSCG